MSSGHRPNRMENETGPGFDGSAYSCRHDQPADGGRRGHPLSAAGPADAARGARPRLLLADDHRILIEGICKLLEAEYDVVGTATDGREVVAAAAELQPDIVVMDIGMPRLNGIEAARHLRLCCPRARIVFLTQHADRMYVREAFRAGASGYLLKQAAASELLLALRMALAGKPYVSRTIAETIPDLLFHDAVDAKAAQAERLGRDLTPRQREVLQLVAEGRSAKEIASILNISIKTVEFHKGAIMDELGLRTTAELTRYALAHGIVHF